MKYIVRSIGDDGWLEYLKESRGWGHLLKEAKTFPKGMAEEIANSFTDDVQAISYEEACLDIIEDIIKSLRKEQISISDIFHKLAVREVMTS